MTKHNSLVEQLRWHTKADSPGPTARFMYEAADRLEALEASHKALLVAAEAALAVVEVSARYNADRAEALLIPAIAEARKL